MSDSLWLHRLQHARPLLSSTIPRVCSHSSPLSQWCYLTISFSVSSSPHIATIFFFLWELLSSILLATLKYTIINYNHHTARYIYPWLNYSATLSLYLLTFFTHFSHPRLLLASTNVFFVSRVHILASWYSVCLSLFGIFHLAEYCQYPSMLLQVARFCSFLWPNNIPPYGYATFSLFIYPWVDTWIISMSCYCK